jgi:hypothetical protein
MAKAQVKPFPVNTLEQALAALAVGSKTQSGQHIKPLHGHCSTRLVVEGGFPPEWMHPRPPMESKAGTNNRYQLIYSKAADNPSEQSVLGGMKYKNVDVTVMIPGIGPALGISAKSTGNAFRNLTNRMEEAPGDCVNIHMMYPGFVFGFLHLIKFAKTTEVNSPNDASFDAQGQPLESIVRYHNALSALTGRATITDPQMRYESVGLLVYRCSDRKSEVCQIIRPWTARFIILSSFRNFMTPTTSDMPTRILAVGIIENFGSCLRARSWTSLTR